MRIVYRDHLLPPIPLPSLGTFNLLSTEFPNDKVAEHTHKVKLATETNPTKIATLKNALNDRILEQINTIKGNIIKPLNKIPFFLDYLRKEFPKTYGNDLIFSMKSIPPRERISIYAKWQEEYNKHISEVPENVHYVGIIPIFTASEFEELDIKEVKNLGFIDKETEDEDEFVENPEAAFDEMLKKQYKQLEHKSNLAGLTCRQTISLIKKQQDFSKPIYKILLT